MGFRMRQRFFLIFNAAAGMSRITAVTQLVACLEQAGAMVTRGVATSTETARAEAAAAARSGHYDALIACGGDGTVRQAAAAAAGTGCLVGGFMLGTGNVLAHELGLPRNPAGAAEMFLHGATVDVRMGLANGDPFLLMAGVGFDGRVIAALNQRLKQTIAKVAYAPATLKALAPPIDDLTVVVDGHTHTHVAWAIVTSASCYGGAFRLTRRTRLSDDGLVAILLRADSRIDLIRHNVAIARGRLDDVCSALDSQVVMTPCADVRITSEFSVPVQIDGDAFGAAPLHIDANGPRVTLIVPK